MPRGAYRYDDGTVEHFSCAPGPAGWRYVSTYDDGRLDLTCDSIWRQLRVEVAVGGEVLRGGVAGADVLWVTGDGQERSAPAAGLAGRSPAFAVAVARRLGPRRDGVRVPLVRLSGVVAALVEEHWRLVEVAEHEIPTGALQVEQWSVTDTVTGDSVLWHLAGDVAVAGPGVELVELESPPTLR